MCGILAQATNHLPVNQGQFNSALQSLKHRGPDGQGVFLSANKRLALGHRRLEIIAGPENRQPIVNHSLGLACIVNGELYQYQPVRRELEKDGYRFLTNSDSEIALALYHKHGDDFTRYLRGEFSLLLFDMFKNRLVACRDRFAIKPLYYHATSNQVIFASEAKAILALGIKAAFNPESLVMALGQQYLPERLTLFRDIYQVKAGHLLTVNLATMAIKERAYWDIPRPENSLELASFQEAKQILEQKLKESVTLRLRNGPVALHLSGGLDSSLVAAFASQAPVQAPTCFSIAYQGDQFDESAQALSVSKALGLSLHTLPFGTAEFTRYFARSIFAGEGLAINSHIAAKYMLNRQIRRQGFKVALGGEGADEFFWGYTHLHSKPVRQLLRGAQLPSGRGLAMTRLQNQKGHVPVFFRAKATIGFKLQQLLQPGFGQLLKNYQPFDHVIDDYQHLGHLQGTPAAAYLWAKLAMGQYILRTLGDGQEMASSIEVRLPFLDHHLVEFCCRLPAHFKSKAGIQKLILRSMAKKFLPADIANRPKHSFMGPPAYLSDFALFRKFFLDYTLSRSFQELGIFDADKIEALVSSLRQAPLQKQVVYEPVLMMILSTAVLQAEFKLVW